VFGDGKERHVANWESVKVVDRTEEESEDGGATVIREKERFSQRLTLLYADGRIALLAEKVSEKASAKENGHAECAPQDGEADLRSANPRHDHERVGPSRPAGCRAAAGFQDGH
jgi:hypothetical protein